MDGIHVQIQFEHIDAWLAQNAELSAQGVFGDEGANLCFIHVALAGHARNLEFRCGGRNLRVQAGTGGSHQIDRDWRVWILRLEFLYVAFHSVQQSSIRGAQIGAAACGGIVSASCCRRPRMKIARASKSLSDDSRPYHSAIPLDELPIRAAMKQNLREAGDCERIYHAEDQGCNRSEPDGDEEIFFHKSLRPFGNTSVAHQ